MKRVLIIGGILLGFIIVMCAAGDPCTAEEKFPAKPITFLVGFAPGGGGDSTSRGMTEPASKILGQPVVVQNRPGGGGAVALGELKNAQPDGYTIGLMTTGAIVSPHMRKVAYHPVDDFEAILQTNDVVYGLVVRTDSPYKTLKDLIDYAQANPNKLKYSTSGAGTSQHLVMVQLGDLLNVKWTHVPFGSGVEAVSALLGGHVDFESGAPEWKSYVASGRLRLLATFGERRIESYRDVPTLIELGHNITAPNICCVVGPKGIPKDRMKILHDAFYKATEDPGFRKVSDTFDQTIVYKNSYDTQLFIKEIYENTGKLLRKSEKQ